MSTAPAMSRSQGAGSESIGRCVGERGEVRDRHAAKGVGAVDGKPYGIGSFPHHNVEPFVIVLTGIYEGIFSEDDCGRNYTEENGGNIIVYVPTNLIGRSGVDGLSKAPL